MRILRHRLGLGRLFACWSCSLFYEEEQGWQAHMEYVHGDVHGDREDDDSVMEWKALTG